MLYLPFTKRESPIFPFRLRKEQETPQERQKRPKKKLPLFPVGAQFKTDPNKKRDLKKIRKRKIAKASRKKNRYR